MKATYNNTYKVATQPHSQVLYHTYLYHKYLSIMNRILKVIFVFIVIAFSFCQFLESKPSSIQFEQQTIEGALTFELVNFTSLYGAPKPTIDEYFRSIDNFIKDENLQEAYPHYLANQKLLLQHGLLYKPFIHLKLKSKKVITVFLTEEDYIRIKENEMNLLLEDKVKKVKLSAVGQFVNERFFDCKSITTTKLIK